MTLVLDTSALVARHLAVPARSVAVEAMEADPAWCASALALTEALVLIDRLTDEPELRRELEDAVRLDWDGSPSSRSTRPASTGRPTSPASSRCACRTPSTWPPPTGSPGRCAS